MKKVALILLLCIYGLSSFGLGIKQFYCCGNLKSTNVTLLFGYPREKCSNGDDMTDCCKTTIKALQVKDSHIPADAIDSPLKQLSDFHLYPEFIDAPTISKKPIWLDNPGHAPPLFHGVSIFILHCVYRL